MLQRLGDARATGRTTRMLLRAMLAASEGSRVFVIVANGAQLGWMRNRLRDMCAGNTHLLAGVHVVTAETNLRGTHSDSTRYFEDHWVRRCTANEWEQLEYLKAGGACIE